MITHNYENSNDSTNNTKESLEGYYVFSPTLKDFLEDQLRYFKNKKKIDNKILAGENVSKGEQTEINKTKKLLQRRKVDILDKHIFRSMANLVLFFEYVAKNEDLREIFEEDIKELFGYTMGPDYDKHTVFEINRSIMRRFLESVLTWNIKKDPNNFRLDMINEIYKVFWNYLQYVLSTEYGKMPKIVIDDLSRIEFWTDLYARSYVKSGNEDKDLYKQSKRPIQF